MKAVMIIAAALSLQACVSSKPPIQVSVSNAELVRVDTLYRNESQVQLLTWRSPDQTEYISYATMKENIPLGTRMPVLMRR